MLGSHTVQQQLRVCLKTAKQAMLTPALVMPEGFGIPLPTFVDSDTLKVESVRVVDPCGRCSTEHRVI